MPASGTFVNGRFVLADPEANNLMNHQEQLQMIRLQMQLETEKHREDLVTKWEAIVGPDFIVKVDKNSQFENFRC